MFRVADIFSLSDFQRKTREHIRRLRETGRPEVLTVNGRAELVVYDAATYQEKLAQLDAWMRTEVAQIPADERTIISDHAIFGHFAGE